MRYNEMTTVQLKSLLSEELAKYEGYKSMNLALDMARGKPNASQIDMAMSLLDSTRDFGKGAGDLRNYGMLDGVDGMRKLFADLLGVDKEEFIAMGNSSLNIMYDMIQRAMQFGVYGGDGAWNGKKVKFLCPVPGYDRHFAITELFGIEMINIPMLPTGPDMDMVEQLVSSDESVKGMWCVPKYSNPDGITYSDDTVRRLANLKPKSKDFRIFYDNAYIVHDVFDTKDELLNIFDECKKVGSEDMIYEFVSTSKMTFPGSGVAAVAMSRANVEYTNKLLGIQTIGPDKINQVLHLAFFKDVDNLRAHMSKHASLLRPKFEIVLEALAQFEGSGMLEYVKPNGGYFISINTIDGCAKEVVRLCQEAGVKLTPAGSSFPYRLDPRDRNIRLAPSYPTENDLRMASAVLVNCIKIASYRSELAKR